MPSLDSTIGASNPNQPSSVLDSDPLPVMRLANWPLRDQPAMAVGTLAGIVVASVVAGRVGQSSILGLAAGAVLLLSVWRMIVPVKYELDVRGVQQIFWGRRTFSPWAAFECYESTGKGILLLRSADSLPLNSLKGIYIAAGDRYPELHRLVHYYVHQVGEHVVTVAESHNSQTIRQGVQEGSHLVD